MKILWFDDMLSERSYGELRDALAWVAGESIDTVTTESVFWKQLQSSKYDLFVLDFQLPSKTGVEVAQKVLSILGGVPILFLSEFTSKYHPTANLDPRARTETLFKPLTGLEAWRDQQLRPTVERLTTDLSPWLPLASSKVEAWPGELSDIEAFNGLSMDDQLQLSSTAAQALAPLTQAVFNKSDADFLVVVGPLPKIVRWGGIDEEPPSEIVMQQIETRNESIPVVLYRSVEVGEIPGDDDSWPSCSFASDKNQRKVDVYPTLALEIKGEVAEYHLDTGSIASFLSYEDCLQHRIVEPSSSSRQWSHLPMTSLSSTGTTFLKVMSQPVEAQARSMDGYQAIVFKPKIVKDWRETRLARMCPNGKCPRSELIPGRGHWCGSRWGLVGRDILRLNELCLVLDGKAQRTFVLSKLDDVRAHPSHPGESWEWTPEEDSE